MPFYTEPMQCQSFVALANKHANENYSLTNQDLADLVALSFTKVDGEIAWE